MRAEHYTTDYLIIGAGPAGLQLAYFLQRGNQDYMVLEAANRPGTFFDLFPRHRTLISINKRYTGYEDREGQLRYDWNSLLCNDSEMAFTNYSEEYFADSRDYARYLRDFAERFILRVRYKTPVVQVKRLPKHMEHRFEVNSKDGSTYSCRALVIATGLWLPYIPAIPGIELTENYFDFPTDPKDYANQRVLILGKGNSAFETANHLCGTTRVTHLCSPHSIKFAWRTHFFGHLRAVNNDFLDTYILKGQNSVLDASVLKIEKIDNEYLVEVEFSHAQRQKALIAYDRVLTCTGFRWKHDFFSPDCTPELTLEGRLPAMTSSWESTNQPGIYFAGTLMQMRDFHKTMSNVLHGFRFNILNLSRILQKELIAEYAWPFEALERTAEAVAEKIIQRVSHNAGLMHQPGFLSDVIVVRSEIVEYYDILAVDYVRDSKFSSAHHYYVVTMEYGEFKEDVFAEHRVPDSSKAYDDAYLHPRIQRFERREQVGEHHMSESLENDWRVDEFLGERQLIRQMAFVNQKDASKYQQAHRAGLVNFLMQWLPSGDGTIKGVQKGDIPSDPSIDDKF